MEAPFSVRSQDHPPDSGVQRQPAQLPPKVCELVLFRDRAEFVQRLVPVPNHLRLRSLDEREHLDRSQPQRLHLKDHARKIGPKDLRVGELIPAREADYYAIISQGLAQDFSALSAWTFARNGSNLIDEYIVDNEEYVGVGSGVFSYLNGCLYASTFSLREYSDLVSQGRMALSGAQPFSRRQQMRYRMMMDMFGLRFDRAAFRQRFGVPASRGLWLEMLFFRLLGAFEKKNPAIPTPVGRYLSLVIMREFFTGVNQVRDIARAALSPYDRGECYAP